MSLKRMADSLHAVLAAAQTERMNRTGFVEGELAWIRFERDRMFDAVTRERAKLGKGPRPMADVMRVERMATGHSDYSPKFAFYCAELVLDLGVGDGGDVVESAA